MRIIRDTFKSKFLKKSWTLSLIIELIIKLFLSYPESNKLNNDLLKQHISKALEKVGQGRTDKNGYPIEIDFNELPMLVHMR